MELIENKLTTKQQAFCVNHVLNGGNGTQAAIDAKYGKAGAHARSYELLNREDIQQFIAAESLRQLGGKRSLALKVITSMALEAKSESVRLQAAVELANRSGLRTPEDNSTIERQPITKMQYNALLDEIQDALAKREKTIDGHAIVLSA